MIRPTSCLLLLSLLAGFPPGLDAQESAPPDSSDALVRLGSLFDDPEPLTLEIRADFSQLTGDREEENPEREGTVVWTGPDGRVTELDVQIRTRGNFRLKRSTCSFPPLRLNFKRGQVEGTPFEGFDKVKLVTHCRDGEQYWNEQVIKEYLVYRIYNQLTEESFRVRLARIRYEDTGADMKPLDRMGFLIEPEEALAFRLGSEPIEMESLHASLLAGERAVLTSMFAFLVGNTDWSPIYFHNTVLLHSDEVGYFVVPYDFDFSGAVDAPYAMPADGLGIRTVRERLYRGWCWEADYEAVADRIVEQESAILALVAEQDGLRRSTANDLRRYLESGFTILASDRLRENRIERSCRSW